MNGLELEEYLYSKKDPRFMSFQDKYETQIKLLNGEWRMRAEQIEERRNAQEWSLNEDSNISAIIVVKNEEDTIMNAIKSIAPYVGQIVCLDTGSTDQTLPLLKVNRKNVKLVQEKWDPWHFAKARNFSLEHADRDFVFVIDADEEVFMLPEDIKPEEGVVYWPTETEMPTFEVYTRPRLFARHPGYYYKGAVHNVLVYDTPTVEKGMPDSMIYHWPVLSEKKKRNRDKRNVIFIKEFRRKGNKTFLDYMNHCHLCLTTKQTDEFEKNWRKGFTLYLKLKQQRKYESSDFLIYHVLYNMITNKHNYDYGVFQEHEKVMGKTIDNQFFKFMYHYLKGEFDEVVNTGREYLALCNAGIDKPHQTSFTYKHRREVQFKWNLAEYWINKK